MHGARVEISPTALPHGRDALWYPEFNLVRVSPHLDEAGTQRALDELQAEWRRTLEWHDPGIDQDASAA